MVDTPGYREGSERTPLAPEKVALIAKAREIEAGVNGTVDALRYSATQIEGGIDGRALALAQTKFDEAFMWLTRAIANPERITCSPTSSES